MSELIIGIGGFDWLVGRNIDGFQRVHEGFSIDEGNQDGGCYYNLVM